jgi:hypothetical protein
MVNPEAIEDLLELFVVDVVSRMQVLGLGDELQAVITLQAILAKDVLEGLEVVGVDEE